MPVEQREPRTGRACDTAPLPLLSRLPNARGRSRPRVNARRRGAGVVDRDGLENRYTFTGIVGSNPTPSANLSWELFSRDCSSRNYADFLAS